MATLAIPDVLGGEGLDFVSERADEAETSVFRPQGSSQAGARIGHLRRTLRQAAIVARIDRQHVRDLDVTFAVDQSLIV